MNHAIKLPSKMLLREKKKIHSTTKLKNKNSIHHQNQKQYQLLIF